MKANKNNSPTKTNLSSDKLLQLIEVMSVLNEPVKLSVLAQCLKSNSSTILRFLSALQNRGYVIKNKDTGYYNLTLKFCKISENIVSRINVRNVAVPFLKNLSQIFSETANLSIEENMEVIYVDVIHCPKVSLQPVQRIGKVAPLHCTGVGKLFLSNYSDEELEYILKLKGLPRFTEYTLTNKSDLCAAIAKAQKDGYAFDNEECEIGMRCIAAPIKNYTGKIIAGISVSGPSSRMTDEFINKNISYLLNSAKDISIQMGFKE